MTPPGFPDRDATGHRPSVRRLVAAGLALLAMLVTAVFPVSLSAAEAVAIAHAVVDDGVDDLVVLRPDHAPSAYHLRQIPNVPAQRGAVVPPAPPVLPSGMSVPDAHGPSRLDAPSSVAPYHTTVRQPAEPRAPPSQRA